MRRAAPWRPTLSSKPSSRRVAGTVPPERASPQRRCSTWPPGQRPARFPPTGGRRGNGRAPSPLAGRRARFVHLVHCYPGYPGAPITAIPARCAPPVRRSESNARPPTFPRGVGQLGGKPRRRRGRGARRVIRERRSSTRLGRGRGHLDQRPAPLPGQRSGRTPRVRLGKGSCLRSRCRDKVHSRSSAWLRYGPGSGAGSRVAYNRGGDSEEG